MLAANYNITLDRAANYALVLTINQADGITPVDVTSATFSAEIRDITTKVLKLSFTVTKTTPAGGIITLSLTPVETKTFSAGDSLYEYDLFMVLSSKQSRLLYGPLSVRREVTKTIS